LPPHSIAFISSSPKAWPTRLRTSSGRSGVEVRQQLADPLRRLALARHEQLDPVGARRDDLDRPQLRSRFERRAHGLLQLLRLDRLRQVAVGLLPDRAQQRVGGVVSRHHHDARRLRLLAQTREHLEPVELRHPDVEQHEVEGLLAHALERLLAVHRLGDGVAGAPQLMRDQVPRRGVVVDDEDLAHVPFGRC
jgi:hypothetical protein